MTDLARDKYRWVYESKWFLFNDADGYGIAIHDVYKRIREWEGPGRGFGTITNTDTILDPRPLIRTITETVAMKSAGHFQQGDIMVKVPAYYDYNGNTGGYQLSDFAIPEDDEGDKEILLNINSKDWAIIEGPGSVEKYLYIELHCRELMQ